MRILALDTAMNACSVAVVDAADEALTVLAVRSEPMERGHAEALIPMVGEAMSAAGLTFAELDRVAVTIGPGSFTGTRIGVSAAHGYALARGIPAAGVTTLQAVALTTRGLYPDDRDIIVLFDAQRGEVYGQAFRGPFCVPIAEPAAYTVAGAMQLLPRGSCILAGSGAHLLAQASRRGNLALADVSSLPDPVCVARLGLHARDQAMPLYLRPPDAKPQAPQILRAG
ncbi:tRNA (adenosine(37)-N6)-threonylcarbamoyltransferase complex dimerization subunit type 1 TsaB [Rhodoligotrophos defluvii]|uniref:tRNA (adenosine(37)-N6)-threonylcarbamoyltransferase complex dimerization subunit type 1 TsaB n=1 Tax=Rhodoligotrophos defluvii TaxID=2561934 RepID=UPI0010C9634F|nr:tRNA (adenosine(37)-N6)-threonylcarbamoyltransferase complex dimerization subunit type 1 TsaB [Rhodoligotrophos defluvii]